jgi:cation transport ATPase
MFVGGQAITKLMDLAPPTATLVTEGPNGREEQEVPSALIQLDDLLKVLYLPSPPCLVVHAVWS